MENSYLAYRILLIVLILVLNAFFAAAEVSLVSSRRFRLRVKAEEGHLGAQAALSLLANPERLLSVTQVGVTLASLGLGWAGEETLYNLIIGLLHPALTPATAKILHGVGFGMAFLLMSYAHVVLGEVVPKNLALEKADRLAMIVSPALLVFYRISGPFVYVVERTAATLSRLMGLKAASHGGGHSSEELKFIVSSSRSAGHLHAFEEDAIQRVLDLQDYAAREIMVPRNNIVSIPVDATLDQVLRIMNENLYSRVPVYEKSPEQIVGIVHYRDLLGEWEERRLSTEKRRPVRPFQLRRLLRKPLVVPETKPLSQLIDEFRAHHAHMAMVVDEFGTIAGLVTLEDVLEQIFGEIEDEHDVKRPAPSVEAPVLDIDGSINTRDLENQYGIELPADAGFETLAGFLLFKLGYIPKTGESVNYDERKFTVQEMERNRIAKVRIEKQPAAKPVSVPRSNTTS